MKLLALELATEACSVALWIDGDVRERFEIAPRRHAELALPWAEQLLVEAGLKKSQLDAIALGRGPGAFTGVRLAIAIGQGIALALDRPIVPVSTLAALAAGSLVGGAPEPAATSRSDVPIRRVLASIDARMNEIYTGAFELHGNDVAAISTEAVLAPELAELPDDRNDWHGIGTGFAACDGALSSRLQSRFVSIDPAALPHAAAVAHLAAAAFARGEAVAPEQVEPAYLRNHVALTIVEQRALRESR
ncbi:MAG TPA: tRNA (adenosine(37)-N6)-threonylcarbamoyltransferase complex dimerization subunit type 1 TsaB [Lysobacter sp.]|nr:tRNA (adenosine(37)-N6)-threonylcarbamoyltransferase complex dimerization subunit type 1 TsaB [Lysobacter sp.]